MTRGREGRIRAGLAEGMFPDKTTLGLFWGEQEYPF